MNTTKNNENSLFSPKNVSAINSAIFDISAVHELIPTSFCRTDVKVFKYNDEHANEHNYITQPLTKTVVLGDKTISASVTRNQIRDLKAMAGIDVIEMLTNTLINEASLLISKETLSYLHDLADKNKLNYSIVDKILSFIYKLGKRKYVKKIKVDSADKLAQYILMMSAKLCGKNKSGTADFCIVGAQTCSILQDSKYYTSTQITQTLKTTKGSIYEMGTIDNIKLFVDPQLSWNNNSVLLGRKTKTYNTGLHLVFNTAKTSMSIVEEHPDSTANSDISGINAVLKLKINYAIFEKGLHPEYNYTKFTHKSNLNLI